MYFHETCFDRLVRRSALILSVVNVVLLCLLLVLALPPVQIRIIQLITGVVAVLALVACMHEVYESGWWSIIGVVAAGATVIGLLVCALGFQ